MNISTTYMGLKLKSPLIVGSSDLTNNIDNIIKCEEFGAGAIVLKSLFEEQIIAQSGSNTEQEQIYFWYPEAMKVVKKIKVENGVDAYIKLIESAKNSVKIPVIASINCVSDEVWPQFAKKIEIAGADALELNISIPPISNQLSSTKIEDLYINIIKAILKEVSIPVSIKVSFYFSNISRMLFKLSNTGIAGMVLFNRYFRPDIDIDTLKFISNKSFSGPDEITLALRWMALLSPQTPIGLVGSTGVHDYSGIVKYLLCGASAVQICSALYKNDLSYIKILENDLKKWMTDHSYSTIDEFKGLLSKSDEHREGFERIQFIKRTTGLLK